MGEKSPTAFTSDSPLVTIVITSYNYGRTVGEAIASALGQSYENIEVLVLDNASTDDSVEVTRAIRDPRLRIVARKSNIGIQKNHNDGIARARGEYVVFLSADDLLLPNLVTDAIDYYRKHPAIDIVYFTAAIADARGRIVYLFDHPAFDGAAAYSQRNEFASLLTRDSYMYLPTTLFRKKIFSELGLLDEKLTVVLDYEYDLRMASAGKTFGFVNKPGAIVRFHGENRSGVEKFVKSGMQIDEFLTILERYTQPRFWPSLTGYRDELFKTLDRKIHEMQDPFPLEFAAIAAKVKPRIERVRALIGDVPAIGGAVLAGIGKISVVVPFAGRLGFLQRALESLALQTYGHWEAIIGCDIDTDPSGLVAMLGLADRVRVVRAKASRGPGATRNMILGSVTGEIVCYLDDDNRFTPDYLALVARTFADPAVSASIARSQIEVVTDSGDVVATASVGYGLDEGDCISPIINRAALCGTAHRRSLLAFLGGFDPSLSVLEDWDFLLRLTRIATLRTLDFEGVRLGVLLGLRGHQIVGRNTQAQWNDYVAAVREIYRRWPIAGEIGVRRENYIAHLETAINRGLQHAREPSEVLRFVTTLIGLTVIEPVAL
jgi:glycosyltransferase involved in cell wall biosynthesis